LTAENGGISSIVLQPTVLCGGLFFNFSPRIRPVDFGKLDEDLAYSCETLCGAQIALADGRALGVLRYPSQHYGAEQTNRPYDDDISHKPPTPYARRQPPTSWRRFCYQSLTASRFDS
jgi:hypothetical protein